MAFIRGRRNRSPSSEAREGGATLGNAGLYLHTRGIPLGEAMTPREEIDLVNAVKQDRAEVYAAWVHAYWTLAEKGRWVFPGWVAILNQAEASGVPFSLCKQCKKVDRYSFLPPAEDDGLCSYCRLEKRGNVTVRVVLDPCKLCQRPRSHYSGQCTHDGADGLCRTCRATEARRKRRDVAAALAARTGVAKVVCAECGEQARPRDAAERTWALAEVALCPECVKGKALAS